MRNFPRRRFLGHGLAAGALLASGGLAASRVSFAAPLATDRRFVFVILRGALDGLAAVPPVGDPDLARLRGALALTAPGSPGGALELDGFFALHPSLSFLHESWQAARMSVVHAVATPYRERSHFDAQDVLESGFARPHAATHGWLNRALATLPPRGSSGSARAAGVALGQSIPLVMRGPVEVASWSASRLPDIDSDTLQRIGELYAGDATLSVRLADALAASELVGNATGPNAGRGLAAQVEETARATARFLAEPDGPRVAVFETTGWDTHANQGATEGALALRLAALDRGLRALQEALGPAWERTVVLVATEFGRTAAVNGTRGTDHGTGAAAFLLGGAVDGGRVIGHWPGLGKAALHQGRDLQPTTDLRTVMKSVLRDHLEIPVRQLEGAVFPDSAATGYISGLVRS